MRDCEAIRRGTLLAKAWEMRSVLLADYGKLRMVGVVGYSSNPTFGKIRWLLFLSWAIPETVTFERGIRYTKE